MLVQIEGVGDHKIKYRDQSEVEFDNLYDYIILAKKSISKFANRFYSGLSAKMLKDEDAISSVANAIIMADWRYDDNYKGPNNKQKTKYSYRNQCALWAIQTYVTKNYKSRNISSKFLSLDYNNEENEDTTHSYIVDKRTKTPEEILIEKEGKAYLSSLIDQLLNSDCISKKQSEYIKLYYFEGMTFEEIGKQFGLTREAIRQSINKALSLISSVSTD